MFFFCECAGEVSDTTSRSLQRCLSIGNLAYRSSIGADDSVLKLSQLLHGMDEFKGAYSRLPEVQQEG